MSENPIKKAREDRHLSQGEAGVKVGTNAMTFSRWERGIHLPRKKYWPALEREFGLTPSVLVGHVTTSVAA